MRVLALETTTAHGSLAWLEGHQVLAACDLIVGQYSQQLLPAMERLASQAASALEQVDGFAVANGPGSFTGVRIGLAAVKGLIEVWRKPAVAISTLAAVVAAGREKAGADSPRADFVAALDAARGEVYFRLGAQGEDRLAPLEEFCRIFEAPTQLRLVTPHPGLAAACAARLQTAGLTPSVVIVPARLAPAVGRLGREELAAVPAWTPELALRLDANYVRRSDAEIFAPAAGMAARHAQ
ncbi:MAG: tRNA (adenosine(37)-N6)-threonylcarbamoyltransferase complex dimerization subunit type 1 TsaB [Terriglobales bacterium]